MLNLQEGIVPQRRHLMGLAGRIPVAMVAACPFPAQRGTPIRIRQMGEALNRSGFDVHLVTYHLGQGPPPPGMTLHRIRKLDFYQDYAAGPNYAKLLVLDPLLVFRLAQVVRTHGIRLVHAHHFEGALCALVVKRLFGGIQVIYDAHTALRDELLDYRFPMPRTFKKIAADLLDSGIPRWSDHVVTVSDSLKEIIHGVGVPERRISVIPMGVNTGEFLSVSSEEGRRLIGLGGEPTVVYTGNLAPFQGVDRLLRAMIDVVKEIPQARLVVVGRHPPAYDERVRDLGLSQNVTLAGEKPFADVRTYLAAADVVVLPRDNCPGFPLKLLNYMAAGRAIVAFRGGSKDVLHHLQNGYVVDHVADADLARGIIHCLRNPELSNEMGQAARETAQDFDLSSVTRRVQALYRDLLPPGLLVESTA